MKKIFLLSAMATMMLSSCTVNDDGDLETTPLFWGILAIAGLLMLVAMIHKSKQEELDEQRESALDKISNEYDYHISAEVTVEQNRKRVIFDNDNKKLIVIDQMGQPKEIRYSDIRGVELVEDGTVLQSKSMMRTVGGALIGNIVAGGAGMIVGGLSGNTKEKKKISMISVVLKLRDVAEPTYTIECFNSQLMFNFKEVDISSSLYQDQYRKEIAAASKIVEMVGVVIDANENEQKANQVSQPIIVQSSNSDVDALDKLVSMKEQGLLSEEEFQSMKSKIINSQKANI